MLRDRAIPRSGRPGAQAADEVEVGDTIRMLSGTCSVDHRAPDGGIKFPEGLVVTVDDVRLDVITARRWVRNRVAEVFPGGVHGDVVTAEERVADPDDLDGQIARLQALRDRAKEIRARPLPPTSDPTGPLGRDAYRVPASEQPLRRLGLADRQVEALENAGFTTQAAIDNATDEEILEVKGVGKPTLAKLRGRAE